MAKSTKKAIKKEKKVETKATSNKMDKFNPALYSSLLFGVGILIAIIGSFIPTDNTNVLRIISVTLIIIGILIGIVNITKKESTHFLIAVLSFLILSQMFLQAFFQILAISNTKILVIIGALFANFVLLIAPAAFVVALKTIFYTAKDE